MSDFENQIRQMADAMFAELDINNDGKVSMEEAHAVAKKYQDNVDDAQF